MWEAVVVLLVAGLAIARYGDVVYELIAQAIQGDLPGTQLSYRRIVIWIVAAIFGVITVSIVEYDPIAATGIADNADDIWNILFVIASADIAHYFFEHRLLRSGAAAERSGMEARQAA